MSHPIGLTSPSTPAGSYSAVEMASIATEQRFEHLLLIPRALVGFGIVILSVITPSLSPSLVVLIGLLFGVISIVVNRFMQVATTKEKLNQVSTWAAVADGICATGILILLGWTPASPGILLFPLLGFEITLKWGKKGAFIATILLAIGVAGRMYVRVIHFGLHPRYNVILLVVAISSTFLGFAFALRSNESARNAALLEKERIAASLRQAVTELLNNAGFSNENLEADDLEVLLNLACGRPGVGQELGKRLVATLSSNTPDESLTKREREILQSMAQGLSDKEIATQLYLSQGTIRVHISNIVRKLEVENRQEAIKKFKTLTLKD